MTLKEYWKKSYRIMRKTGCIDRVDTSVIAQRAELYDCIRQKQVDGKISFNTSGMDCDCVRYRHGSIEWATPMRAIEKMIDDLYYHAEGPVSFFIGGPHEKVSNSQRDLALEAFEDGHPHTVSEVRYECD